MCISSLAVFNRKFEAKPLYSLFFFFPTLLSIVALFVLVVLVVLVVLFTNSCVIQLKYEIEIEILKTLSYKGKNISYNKDKTEHFSQKTTIQVIKSSKKYNTILNDIFNINRLKAKNNLRNKNTTPSMARY